MEKIEEKVMAAFETADEETRTSVMNLLGVAPTPVTERVKTMDDVMAELGENHPLVVAYSRYLESTDIEMRDRHLLAYLKLRMVAEALNEGWYPQYLDEESHWYPEFTVFENMKDVKQAFGDVGADGLLSLPYLRQIYQFHGRFAVVETMEQFAGPGCAKDYPFFLCYKTHELALHAGMNFPELWCEWLFL